MKNISKTALCIYIAAMFAACSDNDSFSASPDNMLTFDTDTLSLDTVFSTLPSPHKVLMVHNNSGDGLRITNVRLNKGNQTGFRVNVNGTFLGEKTGWQVNDLELRKNDSLRVFVELTSNSNNDTLPRIVSDNLVFTLESGVRQQINLKAWSWDAFILRDITLDNDTTIRNEKGKPVVVFGNINVNKGATLSIAPGTTIYFHSNSGIYTKGSLKINGEKDKEVTLRCDRLDRMVSNLTYDNNPGQWGGIKIDANSYNNEITYTDLHGATDAIVCDSSLDATRAKLTVRNSTIHNVKGCGIKATNSNVTIENSQISNTKDTCLAVKGGKLAVNNTTIVQYYPFDANRGPALVYGSTFKSTDLPLAINMDIKNSIIKGYADDVIYQTAGTEDTELKILFANSLLRTPQAESRENVTFENCIFEDTSDTLTNARNSFILFDTDNFFYDFTPKEGTAVIGMADPKTSLPEDRKGKVRSTEKPDAGCYETDKGKSEE